MTEKERKQVRLFDILYWMKSRPHRTTYDAWLWWASDSRRQRVSSDTIGADLRRLNGAGFIARSSAVQNGCRTYHFTITRHGLRVIEDRERGIHADL